MHQQQVDGTTPAGKAMLGSGSGEKYRVRPVSRSKSRREKMGVTAAAIFLASPSNNLSDVGGKFHLRSARRATSTIVRETDFSPADGES